MTTEDVEITRSGTEAMGIRPGTRGDRGPTVPPGLLFGLLLCLLSFPTPTASSETGAPIVASGASLAAGRYVFERHCRTCHGPRGNGRGELAVGMLPPPRDFRRGLFKYRSTPSGSLPTDADLTRTIRSGISGTAMPAFAVLTSNEVVAVVAYVKSLSARWTNAALHAAPLVLPARPAWFEDPAKRATHAAAGQKLFQGLCAPCHGQYGAGDGPAAAQLQDAWDRPCPPRDLRAPHLHAGSEPEDLFRTLSTGLDGTPMPSFAESTTAEQRWDLVAYVRSLPPGTPR